jgi:hypothetical protein
MFGKGTLLNIAKPCVKLQITANISLGYPLKILGKLVENDVA